MRQPIPTLKSRALRYLSRREHSRAELERKLLPYVQEGEDMDAVLDDLERKGFISQERVIESVLRQRASKMGSLRLRQELHTKGVDAQAISEAMQSLADSEVERACQVWGKKYGTPAKTPTERAQHMRFLAYRGFSGDTITKAMRAVGAKAGEDGMASTDTIE